MSTASVVVQYPITVLTAAYTLPDVDASASATVGSTVWMVPGQFIVIATLGTLKVASITGPFAAVLANPGSSGNQTPGTIAPIGSGVGVSGAAGPSGAGGTTTTTGSYEQPPVGSTVIVDVVDPSSAVVGRGAEIAGGGFYTVTNVAGPAVTLLNRTSAVNAIPLTVIASGAVVTFGGIGAPQTGNVLDGQAQQLQGGAFVGAGMREIVNPDAFGLFGDGGGGSGNHSDRAALQAAADSIVVGSNQELVIPVSATQFLTTDQTCSMYALNGPLVVGDAGATGGFPTTGSGCKAIRGEHRQAVGLMPTWGITGNFANPDWFGPLLIGGTASDTNAPAYTTDGGHTCLSCGTILGASQPSICFSEFDMGSIHAATGFCFEMLIDPGTDVPASLYELASSYGNDNFENHCAFSIDRGPVAAQSTLNATLSTTGGTATIQATTGHDLTLSTLQHIALDYDGSHVRLWVNGVQTLNNQSGGTSDATAMTAALTGTVVQMPEEEVWVLTGRSATFPSSGPIFSGGTSFKATQVRMSNASRYTAPFTPPTVLSCDISTKIYVPLDGSTPATAGATVFPDDPTCWARDSLSRDFVIGYTGAQINFQSRVNAPVFLHLYLTENPYTQDLEISNLYFYSVGGRGIEISAGLNTRIHHCRFTELAQGIEYRNYSYGSSDWDLDFVSNGRPGNGFHSWNLLDGHGAQDMTHGDNIQSNGSSTGWHLVHTFSDVKIGSCFLGGNTRGSFYFQPGSTGSITARGVHIDDEGGSQKYCAWLLNGANINITGGSTFNAAASVPTFKVDNIQSCTIDHTVFAADPSPGPIFSFASGFNPTVPVLWVGYNPFTATIIDASAPGPVIDPRLGGDFGLLTMTPTGNVPIVVGVSGYTPTPSPGDVLYYDYAIANSGWTGTQPVTWPSNPGKKYQVHNLNTHTATLTSASGATTIAGTTGTYRIQDQVTVGMVSL